MGKSTPVGRSLAPPVLAALLVLVHVALVLHGATRHSAVFDEVVYPTSGRAYLKTGDYRLNREHPPLLKLWTGAAWLGDDFDFADAPGWSVGDQWSVGMAAIYGEGRPHASLLFRARAMIAALSCALAVALFGIARRLAGEVAGLAALTLYVFDPLAVAHAGLATTDLGATCFLFLAAAAFPTAISRGGTARTVGAGLLLGLALASKFSNLLLLGVLGLAALAATWPIRSGSARDSVARPLSRVAVIVAVASAVVAATYGPAGPGLYVEGVRMLLAHAEVGHPSYAFGRYGTSVWWYFPAAWAVKTPIPILVASLAGVVVLCRRLRSDRVRTVALLGAPALALGAALGSSLNLGVRHLLPIAPFMAVGGGLAAAAIWPRGRRPRAVVLVLAAWLAAGTLAVHPHELAYANEVSGGPSRLWRKLADSNVDWGQDLPALAEEVGRHPLRRLYLGYFGTADPGAYGLRYCWIPSMRMIDRRYEDGPDPHGREWIAISVTNLLNVYSQRPEIYAWLRDRPFDAFPGYSIALFDVTGDAEAHRKIGETALALGDAETAVPPLRRAVELAPEDESARACLARALEIRTSSSPPRDAAGRRRSTSTR